MKFVFVIVVAIAVCLADARIVVKREVEREGQPKETVMITDKNSGNDVELVGSNGNGGGEVIEFDLDNRGVLSFGGRIPAFDFDNIQQRMREMIEAMVRRMHEMEKRMNETVSKYPDNYNKTNVEIVEIAGKKYRKETTIFNRRVDGITIYSKSSSLVPVEDSDSGSSEDVETVENRKPDQPKVTDKEKEKTKSDEIEREETRN